MTVVRTTYVGAEGLTFNESQAMKIRALATNLAVPQIEIVKRIQEATRADIDRSVDVTIEKFSEGV